LNTGNSKHNTDIIITSQVNRYSTEDKRERKSSSSSFIDLY